MLRVRLAHPLLIACALLALTGCHLLDSEEWERTIGYIDPDLGTEPGSLEVPATVRRGVPFEARVVTYGSSSCTRPDGAEVKIVGLVAEITPYDLVPAGNAHCTADLRPFPRMVTIQFDEAGDAVVRLSGLSVHPDVPFAIYEAELVVEP